MACRTRSSMHILLAHACGLQQPVPYPVRQSAHMAWPAPTGKAHMPAVAGLPQRHTVADIGWPRQAAGGHKGVVERIDQQGRHTHTPQQGLGRCTAPVIVCVPKAMQRRREHIVKVKQVTRSLQALALKQAGVLGELGQSLGLQISQANLRLPVLTGLRM